MNTLARKLIIKGQILRSEVLKISSEVLKQNAEIIKDTISESKEKADAEP